LSFPLLFLCLATNSKERATRCGTNIYEFLVGNINCHLLETQTCILECLCKSSSHYCNQRFIN
jgi:hypothetical protein